MSFLAYKMNKWTTVSVLTIMFVSLEAKELLPRPPFKIVNGTTAEEGEFPYMVQLRDSYGYFSCGGSIIAAEWILTAGHCIGDIDSIVYGTNKLYDHGDGSPNTSISVKNSFRHPNYTIWADVVIYDVGLLQLAEPIPFDDKAQPVKLAEVDDDERIPFHKQGVLSGWGVNETSGYAQPYLQKIHLQLLTDEECQKKINDHSGRESFIPIHNLCSDDYYNGECYGDSGSPYVINGTQYGIVSWSYKPCGVVPGTYSRITNPIYGNWIRETTSQ